MTARGAHLESPPSDAPPAPEIRSPLLDWLRALRLGAWKLVFCVGAGAAIAGGWAALRPARSSFNSVTVLSVEPDFIELSLAAMIGVPVGRDDRAFADAMLFENAASSDATLFAAIESLGLEKCREGFGAASGVEKVALAHEIRRGHLKFDYKIGNPKVTLTVSASSGEHARDFARALLLESRKRFSASRQDQNAEGLTHVRERKAAAQSKLEEMRRQLMAIQSDTADKSDSARLKRKTELESQAAEQVKQIEFLSGVESKCLEAGALARPTFVVLDEPSLPPRAEAKPRHVALWTSLGGAGGLSVALLWIAFVIHRKTMRDLNPERYGATKGDPN